MVGNQYHILLTEIEKKDGSKSGKQIDFSFENHDDIFRLLEGVQDKAWFDDPKANTEFVMGLKLFGEVMIKNHKNPIFNEILPAFKQMMKKLKAKQEK